jgi:hypothetical protein
MTNSAAKAAAEAEGITKEGITYGEERQPPDPRRAVDASGRPPAKKHGTSPARKHGRPLATKGRPTVMRRTAVSGGSPTEPWRTKPCSLVTSNGRTGNERRGA